MCFNFSETDPCHICEDAKRSKDVICVVSKPQDVAIIEKTNSFTGLYHILGGNINPLENISPQQIKIKELLIRIKQNNATEIILALNPDMQGETTSLYLTKLIKQIPDIKITRLARGLPMGADLEYADEVTLENALKDRREI
jgi:recombination protein RecR